jgi:hypothetical protein
MQLAKLSQAQGSGSTFRPRLNYVRWSHFQTRLPTRSKELPFPAPDNREGIKTPYGRVVREVGSDLDSHMPAKGQSSI